MTTARAAWLDETIRTLARHTWVGGIWLVGSLGRGEADAYSDVDLVVAVDHTAPTTVFTDPVAGLGISGHILYRRPKPRNAPKDGAYLAVGIDLAGLPVLVDVFVWPAATATVSAGATVVYERDVLPRSTLGFIPLMDQHRSDDRRGSDPDAPGTVLMLVQLAGKHLVRGNQPKLAGICDQLAIPTDSCEVTALRTVLDQRIDTVTYMDSTEGVRAVHRLLDLIERHLAGTLGPAIENSPDQH
ncbi:nucleotidyltransferase domain-containing protein [Paractinoplanes hotanensis]|uniref:Nucleotidyltransferase domain-containing protein n=1 Tax=Paractinoplanes hotanensis TaxID=2906497 RepID=A0ABT0Y8P0_9ACTN|nr:nucleotidyltransferase domain-containing protein [Actinoplanes hotanensis]MCM4081873.1 nucleotidyltransferase domain-containing protein [Actinoplanes hotanensis]